MATCWTMLTSELELASRSVCMGKHPGVRIKDVNNAIKVAAGLA